MDLLWTNPDPTLDFTAQTINLDYSTYTLLFIEVWNARDIPTISSSLISTTQGVYKLGGATFDGTTGYDYRIRMRRVTTDAAKSSLVFDQGTNGNGVNNATCIPYKIYGVRYKEIVHHVTDYNFYGIDTSNIIATNPTIPYTATEDCWFSVGVRAYANVYDCIINIDGHAVYYLQSKTGETGARTTLPLKKGQVISFVDSRGYPGDAQVFGLK